MLQKSQQASSNPKTTYWLILRRSMTVRGIIGRSIFLSDAEKFPNVEVLRRIRGTKRTPAYVELGITLDGERRILIVPQHLISLSKMRVIDNKAHSLFIS